MTQAEFFARAYRDEFERLLALTPFSENEVDQMALDLVEEAKNNRSIRKKKNATISEMEDQVEETYLRMKHIRWQISKVAGDVN